MRPDRIFRGLFVLYLLAFVLYLFAPLLIMGVAAFNTSRFPTVIPWQGTTLDWFSAMWADAAMWQALWTSAIVAVLVVLVALPVGTAAALVLTTLHARARSFAYAVMVSPLLTPGVVIGISTLILWRQAGVGGGIALIVVAQTTFIICYVMLMVMARLQRFDRTQEEAALGLGASKLMVFRRILLPFLRPALLASGGLAILQSVENYNTTLFVRGFETPLTVFIATKVRTGLTPAVNALALVIIAATVIGAVAYEVARRRQVTRQPRS
ncbi:ABC transporter permease subunit [Paracoccus sp. YIM 132242]|uniref:ABC transporter permease subunit n=1 Tax=Paracoccus lichenicola TaxID=2665644 RepID=A0A6L6HLF2_9RHOB|nr:ABC transporter permease [Paracoccus lichenicola]MTE00007.1 ABC transporter permease subunit [Paracoccus lichenicola]